MFPSFAFGTDGACGLCVLALAFGTDGAHGSCLSAYPGDGKET